MLSLETARDPGSGRLQWASHTRSRLVTRTLPRDRTVWNGVLLVIEFPGFQLTRLLGGPFTYFLAYVLAHFCSTAACILLWYWCRERKGGSM